MRAKGSCVVPHGDMRTIAASSDSIVNGFRSGECFRMLSLLSAYPSTFFAVFARWYARQTGQIGVAKTGNGTSGQGMGVGVAKKPLKAMAGCGVWR